MRLTPDRRRFLATVLLALALGAWSPTASAWWASGINWWVWPNGGNVGDCFGNCGAGCTSNFNPCSGPPQYWDLTVIAGPGLVASGYEQLCEEGGHLYERNWERYEAIGTWTYHGWVAPLCITHDMTCDWWLLGCLWSAPCGHPQYEDSWSYNEWMQGYVYYNAVYVGGPGAC